MCPCVKSRSKVCDCEFNKTNYARCDIQSLCVDIITVSYGKKFFFENVYQDLENGLKGSSSFLSTS
jgi:hypothetical protein